MEYVAAGDVSAEGVHMLSTGGMLKYAEGAEHDALEQAKHHGEHGGANGENGSADVPDAHREVVVATEVGMLYPLRMAAPDVEFIPANAEASCRYMKMITLPKLRDALRDMQFEVRVPEEIAVKARVPIDRMVALG
jgi:quinolinate synthase